MIKDPKPATLARYGYTMDDWHVLIAGQGGVCYICKKEPKSGRLCLDHEHCRGWKKLPPEQRKLWVRGALCWVCNHYYCGRGINAFKAENLLSYLLAFESRRPMLLSPRGRGPEPARPSALRRDP